MAVLYTCDKKFKISETSKLIFVENIKFLSAVWCLQEQREISILTNKIIWRPDFKEIKPQITELIPCNRVWCHPVTSTQTLVMHSKHWYIESV